MDPVHSSGLWGSSAPGLLAQHRLCNPRAGPPTQGPGADWGVSACSERSHVRAVQSEQAADQFYHRWALRCLSKISSCCGHSVWVAFAGGYPKISPMYSLKIMSLFKLFFKFLIILFVSDITPKLIAELHTSAEEGRNVATAK